MPNKLEIEKQITEQLKQTTEQKKTELEIKKLELRLKQLEISSSNGDQLVSKQEPNTTVQQTIPSAEFEGLPQVQQSLFTL